MDNVENTEREWEEDYRNTDLENLPLKFFEPPAQLVRLVSQGKIKKGRAIDLGCGLGIISMWLAKKGFDAVGVDISQTAVDFASRKASDLGLRCRFVKGYVQNLDFPDKTFSFAIDRGCFHHLEPEDREKYIHEVWRVLEDKGVFYLECNSYRVKPDFGHGFSKEDIQKSFSEKFKILFISEKENTSSEGVAVWLYTVLMEKAGFSRTFSGKKSCLPFQSSRDISSSMHSEMLSSIQNRSLFFIRCGS